jgi:N-methylhydantoinase B
MGGGGGWGRPTTRAPDAVLRDVIGGYVSPESAEKFYGVAVRSEPDGWSIDESKTAALRERML